MDWIREWILQIAAVIVLGAICDIIMVEGNIKKYVKPIFGFVLLFTILRPITSFHMDIYDFNIYSDVIDSSGILYQEIENINNTKIIEIYEKKLSAKIEEIIRNEYNLISFVKVSADKNKNVMGDINSVDIELNIKEGEVINTEVIKKHISEKIGTKADKINIVLM